MPEYRLNERRQAGGTGFCYVHRKECHWYPQKDYVPLGRHASCTAAVMKAIRLRPDLSRVIYGCYYCSHPCHNSQAFRFDDVS